MTVRVRVRQVSDHRRKFNIEKCRDIDNVAVHGRWPWRGSPNAGTTVIQICKIRTHTNQTIHIDTFIRLMLDETLEVEHTHTWLTS